MKSLSLHWFVAQATAIYVRALARDIWLDRRMRKVLAKKHDIFESEVRIPDTDKNARYLKAGDPDGKPLILIHGSPGSATVWKDYLRNPPEGYKVIAIDRPGYGSSAHQNPDLHMNVETVKAILNEESSPENKAVVLGHSLGGGVAASAAIDHEHQVDSLILSASALNPLSERVIWLQKLAEMLPFRFFVNRSNANSNRELINYRDFLESLQPRLTEFTKSVLTIHARDDKLVPFSNTHFMREQFNGSAEFELIPIERGGHFITKNSAALFRNVFDRLRHTFQ